jgi:hypothetical protein
MEGKERNIAMRRFHYQTQPEVRVYAAESVLYVCGVADAFCRADFEDDPCHVKATSYCILFNITKP